MPFPPLPSGLPAAADAVRESLAGASFARPGVLWLALLPALLVMLGAWANRQNRAAVAVLGEPATVTGLVTRRGGGRAAGVAFGLGVLLALVGAAGPRWGTGEGDGVAVGRDVVVVLDLSRSMLADDCTSPPTRWQAAVAGAVDLIDGLRNRGGHRAAVLVFAARPKLLVPLTTDYDHLSAALRDLDGAHPPADVRPGPDGPASGTRIGAALAAAVAAHDPRFPGSQDVVLVSDGDDPEDDAEWAAGVSAARTAGVPVHAVGVGDPDRPSTVTVDGHLLEDAEPNGARLPVQTRLREDVLRDIAVEGRGEYLPARRTVPRLGEFFRTRIEPQPSRELTEDAGPQPRDRSAWFLSAAVVLLACGWMRGKR